MRQMKTRKRRKPCKTKGVLAWEHGDNLVIKRDGSNFRATWRSLPGALGKGRTRLRAVRKLASDIYDHIVSFVESGPPPRDE